MTTTAVEQEQNEIVTYAIPIDAFYIRVGPTDRESLDTVDTIKIVQIAEDIVKDEIYNADWGNDTNVDLVSLDGGVSPMEWDDGFSEWAVGGGIVAFDALKLEEVPTVDELQAVVEQAVVSKLLLALQDTPYAFLQQLQYTLVTEDNAPNLNTDPPLQTPPPAPSPNSPSSPPSLPNEDDNNSVTGGANSTNSGGGNNNQMAAIVGSTIGAVAFVVLMVGLLLWRRKRRNFESQQGAFPDKSPEDLPGVYMDPLVTDNSSFPESLADLPPTGEPYTASTQEPYDGQILVLPPAILSSSPKSRDVQHDGSSSARDDSFSVEVFEDASVEETEEERIVAISRKSSAIEALQQV